MLGAYSISYKNCVIKWNSTIHCFWSCSLHSVTLCSIEIPCDNGDIRLVEGTSKYNGRVEVCISGDYYTICDSRWTTADASVTCRQLGYDSQGKHHHCEGSMRKSTIVNNAEHPSSTYLFSFNLHQVLLLLLTASLAREQWSSIVVVTSAQAENQIWRAVQKALEIAGALIPMMLECFAKVSSV